MDPQNVAWRWLALLATVLAWLASSSAAQDVTVIAGVDKTAVQGGRLVELTVLVSGTMAPAEVTPPALTNGHYAGPLRLVMRSENLGEEDACHVQRHIYRIMAGSSGRLDIGEIVVVASGQRHVCPPLAVAITAGEPQPDADAWAELAAERQQAVAGQPLTVTSSMCWWEKLRPTHATLEPLIATNATVALSEKSRERFVARQGRIYRQLSRQSLVIAGAEGNAEIKATCRLTLMLRGEPSQFDEVFGEDPTFADPFFRDSPLGETFGGREKNLQLVAEPLRITIKPSPHVLPIGGNWRLSAIASPDQVYTGQPFSLLLTVEGRGNLDSIGVPEAYRAVCRQRGWQLLHSDIREAKYLDAQGNLRKILRLTLAIPQAGSWQIPGVSWRFCNPWADPQQRSSEFPGCRIEVIAPGHK